MTWADIQRNIFAGESGGDYGALFGYSQRPGGQFAGTDVTNMTIDELLEFQNPRGSYGQWVKGQVGRVSTPAGAYQVVGRTLRDAKNALGLTGQEKFTPELQDKIGQWIYKTQGTGAWEGYKPGAAVAADTMTALGKEATPMRSPTPNMAPAGLLADTAFEGGLGLPPQPQGFWDKFAGGFLADPDRRDRLVIALEGMTLNPNQQLQTAARERLAERREERTTAREKSRTVEWLKSQGLDDLARLAQTDPKTAMTLYASRAKDDRTAAQQNYEFLISQGVDRDTAMRRAFSGGDVFNIGGEGMPGLGKLATDYGYVMDPETGRPRIDPNTGLPIASPIPGSATAREMEQAAEKREERGRQQELSMGTTLESLNLNIQEIEDGGFPVTGPIGALGRMIPGTPAADFSARTKQINARAALDEVQRMRDNSPTGAAVGELTDGEREAIAIAATSLSDATSAEEYLRAAKRFRKTMLDIAHGEGTWSLAPDGRVLLNAAAEPTAAPAPADDERARALRLLLGE